MTIPPFARSSSKKQAQEENPAHPVVEDPALPDHRQKRRHFGPEAIGQWCKVKAKELGQTVQLHVAKDRLPEWVCGRVVGYKSAPERINEEYHIDWWEPNCKMADGCLGTFNIYSTSKTGEWWHTQRPSYIIATPPGNPSCPHPSYPYPLLISYRWGGGVEA